LSTLIGQYKWQKRATGKASTRPILWSSRTRGWCVQLCICTRQRQIHTSQILRAVL